MPKKPHLDISRCPQCGTPMQEVSYRWNPARGDFDIAESCPACSATAPDGAVIPQAAAPSAARPAKARK